MSALAQEKEDLLRKIKIQKERNRDLKEEINRDYVEYSEKVKAAEDEVKVLRDRYEEYEREIGQMAETVDRMGL